MESILEILDFVVSLGLVASLADFHRRHRRDASGLIMLALGNVALGWLLHASARLWSLGSAVRTASLACLLVGLGVMLVLLLRRIGSARWPPRRRDP